MGWIRERILAEHKKHYAITGGCDWAKLAESKIIRQLREDGSWTSPKTSNKNNDLELLKKATDLVMLEDKKLLEELGKK